MIRSNLVAVALLGSCTSLLAQGQYREQILTNMQGQGSVGATTPHPEATTHLFSSADPSASATGRVQFASTPAPYVSVVVSNLNGATNALAGILEYEFDYAGQAQTYIPIRFAATFALRNEPFLSLARAEFGVGTFGNSSNGQFISAQILCQVTPACSPSTSTGGTAGDFSSVQVNISSASSLGESGSSANGTITGTILAPTDAAGRGNGYVRMGAFVQGGVGTSWAFIDPTFEVDQAYLLQDPSASLRIMDGVGNETGVFASPVPEPGSIALMLAGLVGLQLVRRGRQPGLRR